MSDVRITRVQISDLFNEINYDIIIPKDSPISIITAPNGRGKTTILNLISFVFSPSIDVFNAIKDIPFSAFRCLLSNGYTVELEKVAVEEKQSARRKSVPDTIKDRQRPTGSISPDDFNFIFCVYRKNKAGHAKVVYSNFLEDMLSAGPSYYFRAPDRPRTMSHYRRVSSYAYRAIWAEQLERLKKYKCVIPVNYIKADRIQPITVMVRSDDSRDEYDEYHREQKSPLAQACEDIVSQITEARDRYSEAVAQAKDKLPQMFLEDTGNNLAFSEFMQGWLEYRNELTRFQQIGLISPTEDFTKGKDISSVYAEKGKFLSTYLQAFKDTTAPLRDIYRRLNLFKTILDERNEITGKVVSFQKGNVILKVRDKELDLEKLSSGEKHDFIMFYNLIFKSTPNSLVLIDEPEISLHIEWQQSYLDKLIEICKMNGLQAIIATHSPDIVSSHYDCLVDKGESNV